MIYRRGITSNFPYFHCLFLPNCTNPQGARGFVAECDENSCLQDLEAFNLFSNQQSLKTNSFIINENIFRIIFETNIFQISPFKD